ncbi:MerR family DNA-binding transcriptional regulator, partial [Streptomyces microflavus]|uniref:MerR family DNA-binding transcriptional regulator n=1 Tax=Streptomyces microflavus TaxID=1919 RepID=UPI00368EF9DE
MQSYTIGQAARLLGVSPDTARRWADAGRGGAPDPQGGPRRQPRAAGGAAADRGGAGGAG